MLFCFSSIEWRRRREQGVRAAAACCCLLLPLSTVPLYQRTLYPTEGKPEGCAVASRSALVSAYIQSPLHLFIFFSRTKVPRAKVRTDHAYSYYSTVA